MKIVCISDTHNKHLQIPNKYLENVDNSASMIIHAGDMTSIGKKQEVIEFLDWFTKLNFKHKVLIAGNHDFFFDYLWKPDTLQGQIRHEFRAKQFKEDEVNELLSKYPNITYLNDSGVEIEGVKIWGSPVQPWFHDWAFNRTGAEIRKHWDMVPTDTDILITHGPVLGYLDRTLDGDATGCYYLKETILERLKNLKLHVCGHIHEAYGVYMFTNGQTFVNASALNRDYRMQNRPVTIVLGDPINYEDIDYGIIQTP